MFQQMKLKSEKKRTLFSCSNYLNATPLIQKILVLDASKYFIQNDNFDSNNTYFCKILIPRNLTHFFFNSKMVRKYFNICKYKT